MRRLKEKREKDRVTFTFRVTPEQLPSVRFEFSDDYGSKPEMLMGGVHFRLLLRDFAPAPAVARVSAAF